MKRVTFAALTLVLVLGLSGISFAADEATLKLKAELLTERVARIEAQSVILNQQYQTARAELESVTKELKELDSKKDKKK